MNAIKDPLKKIGEVRMKSKNHKMWEFNRNTGELKLAEVAENIVNGKTVKSLVINKGCDYEQGLNIDNAGQKLLKRFRTA